MSKATSQPRLPDGRFAVNHEKSDPVKKTALVLKMVEPNMCSQYDPKFKYPRSGRVVCPDWKATKECGHGLHGWLWGVGSTITTSGDFDPKNKFLVIEVEKWIELNTQKIKFREGNVVFCGSMRKAADYLMKHGAADKPIIGAKKWSGEYSIVVGGEYSDITSGDYSRVVAKGHSIIDAGYASMILAGDCSHIMCADSCEVTMREHSTLRGGSHVEVNANDSYNSIVVGPFSKVNASGDSKIIAGVGSEITVRFREADDVSVIAGEDSVINWINLDNPRSVTTTIVTKTSLKPGYVYTYSQVEKKVVKVKRTLDIPDTPIY
jgi:hypothetical protein